MLLLCVVHGILIIIIVSNDVHTHIVCIANDVAMHIAIQNKIHIVQIE